MKQTTKKKKGKSPYDAKLNRSRRLLHNYGITLKEYDEMLEKQKGTCAICHRAPKNLPLSVDHSHKFQYAKITVAISASHEFVASCCVGEKCLFAYGATRKLAIVEIRFKLKRESVRGLLCFQCNAGLRKYSDDADRMESAAKYLRQHDLKFGKISIE